MKRRRADGQKTIASFLKSPRGLSDSEEINIVDAGSPGNQSRFTSCPICGSNFPFYAIEQHVTSHDGEEKRLQEDSVAELHKVPSTPSATSSNPQPSLLSPTGRNAFDELLTSAKNAFTTKRYGGRFMLIHQDGTFRPVFIINDGSPEAQNLESALPEPSWSCLVEIRNFVNKSSLYLSLCTNLPTEDADLLSTRNGMPPSLLKSMIQKACRLCNANAAAHLSLELLRIAPEEMLRRLSIIALEDACLHPASPILVWIMIALTKDYKPPWVLFALAIRVAAEIAACKWREPIPSDAFMIDTVDIMQLLLEVQYKAEETKDHGHLYASTLVGAILMRVSYGGMAFDMKMLRNFAVAWMKRFNGTYELPEGADMSPDEEPSSGLEYLSTTFTRNLSSTFYGRLLHEAYASIDLSTHLEPALFATLSQICNGDFVPSLESPLFKLQSSHLVPAGVDFHVSDVVNQVLQRTPAKTLESLKRSLEADDSQLQNYIRVAMWHFRSSINHKKIWPLPPSEINAYQEDMREDAKKKAFLAPVGSSIRGIVFAYSEQQLQRQFARAQILTTAGSSQR